MLGFRNLFASEAVAGALPTDQNNPQSHPLGLYTEQISGTSFTRSPRSHNLFVWTYRLLPSVAHAGGGGGGTNKFEPVDVDELACAKDALTLATDANVGRWNPPPPPQADRGVDFVHGLRLFGQAGRPDLGEGLSIYLMNCNQSMHSSSMSFCDGDVLFVPQRGSFVFQTELGELQVQPREIIVIPRGIKFSVRLAADNSGGAAGYLAEVYHEAGFKLPELGVIGANGLANPLHFEHPEAKFDRAAAAATGAEQWTHILKVNGQWFKQHTKCSPFDVVAWRGNLVPCKYNLDKFVAMGSLTVDHPDPSIFTVLTVPTNTPGLAAMDFVIFPPRWMVTERTFRPPYFHRNCMTEFMGLIHGEYDGKLGTGGFVPGGVSLHNRMQPHGPNRTAFDLATTVKLEPQFLDKGLAFMFETPYFLQLTEFARLGKHRQVDYEQEAWGGFPRAKL